MTDLISAMKTKIVDDPIEMKRHGSTRPFVRVVTEDGRVFNMSLGMALLLGGVALGAAEELDA